MRRAINALPSLTILELFWFLQKTRFGRQLLSKSTWIDTLALLSFPALPLVVLFVGWLQHHIDVLCDVTPASTVPGKIILQSAGILLSIVNVISLLFGKYSPLSWMVSNRDPTCAPPRSQMGEPWPIETFEASQTSFWPFQPALGWWGGKRPRNACFQRYLTCWPNNNSRRQVRG